MRLRPMTLTIDDYSKLRSVIGSKVAIMFSDPTLLRDLHQELVRARLVEPEDLPDGVISLNSTVRLRDLRNGAVETYTLVEPQRADIANRRLSILSPGGLAVLGCLTGDTIHWPIPSGWRLMTIEKVTPPVAHRSSLTA